MIEIVNHYRVDIRDKTGLGGERNEFKIEQHCVIGENDKCIVINDPRFTTIQKEKDKHGWNTSLDSHSIGLTANDSVWGNSITFSLYTTGTVTAAFIRKEIEKAVKKKYGFFMSKLKLDCIKEPTTQQEKA